MDEKNMPWTHALSLIADFITDFDNPVSFAAALRSGQMWSIASNDESVDIMTASLYLYFGSE
jgi:hypothetical protein